jgi:predicted RNA-binding protein YlxR (DUF448 family)
MVRIVRRIDGRILVDLTGKAPGRGAYLCRRAPCWRAALRKDVLARSLKTAITAADRAELEEFADGLTEDGAEQAVSGVAEGSKL